MSPLNGREAAERVTAQTARTLTVIAGAMGVGIALLVGLIVAMHFGSSRSPSPDEVLLINRMTGVAMLGALAAIVASEVVWKVQVRALTAERAEAGVQTAYIVRSALREGAALLGAAVALLAAMNGTLRVYPAYWVDLAPAALFFGYLALHFPTLERLKAEVAALLPQ